MQLTPKQIEYFNHQVDINNALLDSGTRKGIVNIVARAEAPRIIGELIRIKE